MLPLFVFMWWEDFQKISRKCVGWEVKGFSFRLNGWQQYYARNYEKKCDEATEKRLKEDLSPRKEKLKPVGKTYKHVGKWFIDLRYVCQQLANDCKVHKKEISLAHYEDETVIGLASTLYVTYLHHNFILGYNTCCFVQKDYFNLNYRNAWGNYQRSLKGTFWIISIGENTLSVEYSDIYHVLMNLIP